MPSQKEHHCNTLPTNGPALQSTQQPQLFCAWSAHVPQSGPVTSPSSFPRSSHTLTAIATATAGGELFLFGGYVPVPCGATNDLYVFSTRDFSTTFLQTNGEVPSPRAGHFAAFIGTTLLIFGGLTDVGDQDVLNHDSLYLLNLVTREWTRVVVNSPGPGGRSYNTVTMIGSKLFVFGGHIGGRAINDMWTLDLNSLKSQPVWESYEPTPGNEKPLPRAGHVSVTTEDRIIIFGGVGNQNFYDDTWSFDISTRKWTELQCTGPIPSPRFGHASVLVDDVMYVFGGNTGQTYLDDLYALQLSTQRWFKIDSVGPSPHSRSHHAMASDGTHVFVLGGYSKGVQLDEISLIYVFDTKDIRYPEPERNAADPNEKTTQLARKLSRGPLTQKQLQNPECSSSEARGASRLQNAAPAVSGRAASPEITHERNPSRNEKPLELAGVNSQPRRFTKDDVSEGPTEQAKFAAPHFSSEGGVSKLELERQQSESLAAQAERDQRIARLADELALKSALLEQAEANAAEAAKHAGLELPSHADRPLMQTSLVEQRDADLVDMQARLDELLLSHDRQIGKYEKELANVRAKLEGNESELEALRLRLRDVEKGWTKSKEEADTLRVETATGSVNRDEDQITRRLLERVRAIEAEMVSKRWNEKRIEEMECSNED